MSDYNKNYLKKSDKDKMESTITFYELKGFWRNDETRVRASAKNHVDYLFGDYLATYLLATNVHKRDQLASLIVTKIKFGKTLPKIIYTFNKDELRKLEFEKLFPLFFSLS